MDIEDKIRSRIEAILLNDARNCAELRMAADSEEPLENEPFSEERNLYQRIISSYRSAISQVNSLLEENVGFLSGFCRIVEGIKDKDDFREVCAHVVDCILQDMGAEYCGVRYVARPGPDQETCCLEGIREQRKFFCRHDNATLLGCPGFYQAVSRLAAETAECANIRDVYRDPRFNSVDFPGVVRSLVCLPLRVGPEPAGALVLSNSLPNFFTDNHTRILRILASTLAHLWFLTAGRSAGAEKPAEAPPPAFPADEEPLSVILLNFQGDGCARGVPVDQESIRRLRGPLAATLNARESIVLYGESELLALLPGIPGDRLYARADKLRRTFREYQAAQGGRLRHLRVNVGYSTCEAGEDLSRTLEIASMMMSTHQADDLLSEAGSPK